MATEFDSLFSLVSYPAGSRVRVIKTLLDHIGLSLNEANQAVERLPQTWNLPASRASDCQEALEFLDADVLTLAPSPAVELVQEFEAPSCRTIEAQSILSLVNRNLSAITGDEDGLEIVAQTSEFSYALEGAIRLLDDLATELEGMKSQAEKEGAAAA